MRTGGPFGKDAFPLQGQLLDAPLFLGVSGHLCFFVTCGTSSFVLLFFHVFAFESSGHTSILRMTTMRLLEMLPSRSPNPER